MKKEIDHEMYRHKLIEGAISAVSKYGYEGCTTKLIAKESNVNEAYIYRYFLDRDDLISKAFLLLDDELFEFLTNNVEVLSDKSKSPDERFNTYFNNCFDFFEDNITYSRFYQRTYLSTFFQESLVKNHNELGAKLAKRIEELNIVIKDPYMTLHQFFTLIFDYNYFISRNVKVDNIRERILANVRAIAHFNCTLPQ